MGAVSPSTRPCPLLQGANERHEQTGGVEQLSAKYCKGATVQYALIVARAGRLEGEHQALPPAPLQLHSLTQTNQTISTHSLSLRYNFLPLTFLMKISTRFLCWLH